MDEQQIIVFEKQEDLYRSAADSILKLAQRAVKERDRFLLVLSGGGTPKPLYRMLASAPYRDQFPWAQTHVLWSDERSVAPDHQESNYAMAYELLLRHVPIPEQQINRMAGEIDPAAASQAYTQQLLKLAEENRAWPRFDVVLLGLGSDGHTASLFPGSTHPLPDGQPVLAVSASYGQRPAARVSLTPRALNSARQIFFLVTGAEKANALTATLQGPRDAVSYPAQRISPEEGAVTWLVDRAAAGKLGTEPLE